MKFIVIDEKNNDMFTKEFNTEIEAVEWAEKDFNNFTEYDKTQRTGYYIIESVNPDTESENHFDGNIIKEHI